MTAPSYLCKNCGVEIAADTALIVHSVRGPGYFTAGAVVCSGVCCAALNVTAQMDQDDAEAQWKSAWASSQNRTILAGARQFLKSGGLLDQETASKLSAIAVYENDHAFHNLLLQCKIRRDK